MLPDQAGRRAWRSAGTRSFECLKRLKAAQLLRQESEAEQHAEAWARIRGADGILVPGGFGSRGVEGKIAAAKYAREHGRPYLGICLGMQIAVIEVSPPLSHRLPRRSGPRPLQWIRNIDELWQRANGWVVAAAWHRPCNAPAGPGWPGMSPAGGPPML